MIRTFGELYETWQMTVNPSATTARMTRTALKYVAAAANHGHGNGDWASLPLVPEQNALVLLDAAMAKKELSSQSRSNYRFYIRRIYRLGDGSGRLVLDDADAFWPPVPEDDGVPRRAQVAYQRFVKWAIGRQLWPATVAARDPVAWACGEKADGNAHWRKDYERLRIAWGHLVAAEKLHPLSFAPLPASVTTKYAISTQDWPRHLRDEWQRMVRNASAPLRDGGMRPWRETTRLLYESRLALILGWFVATHPGVGLGDATWATLLSPENCKAYINWLAARAGEDVLNPGHTAILRSIRGLHRFLLGSDPAVVKAFVDLARRCEVEERDKAVRIVPYPTLEAALAKLLARHAEATKTVPHKLRSPSKLATLQVNAVLWGLLVCRALRQRNIRQLRVGKNLVETDDGYQLRFEAREMKGHRTFTTTCPSELVPVIRDYLRNGYRTLAGRNPRDGDVLLLTRRGTPFNCRSVGLRVSSLNERLVGKRLGPHIFRHIAATYLAQVRHLTPTELAAFLAHRSPATLMGSYEITSPTKAAARVDEQRRQAGDAA